MSNKETELQKISDKLAQIGEKLRDKEDAKQDARNESRRREQ